MIVIHRQISEVHFVNKAQRSDLSEDCAHCSPLSSLRAKEAAGLLSLTMSLFGILVVTIPAPNFKAEFAVLASSAMFSHI